jgi:hypothetical protein
MQFFTSFLFQLNVRLLPLLCEVLADVLNAMNDTNKGGTKFVTLATFSLMS